MTEIYGDLPKSFKKRVEMLVEIALQQPTLLKGMQLIKIFSSACSAEEQEYIDFYLKLKMETLQNENNND